MVEAHQIISAINMIAATYKPQKILLFGFYAYGMPTVNSDVDLLVLKQFTGSAHRQFVKIHKTLRGLFPLDLLVRRTGDVQKRIESNDFFLKEVVEKGIVLYAADDPRVGEQGRRRLRRHLNNAANRSIIYLDDLSRQVYDQARCLPLIHYPNHSQTHRC